MSATSEPGRTSARVPNLVIVGVVKSGTTSLFNYLSQHPDICPSDVKETRYFDPLRFGGMETRDVKVSRAARGPRRGPDARLPMVTAATRR